MPIYLIVCRISAANAESISHLAIKVVLLRTVCLSTLLTNSLQSESRRVREETVLIGMNAT